LHLRLNIPYCVTAIKLVQIRIRNVQTQLKSTVQCGRSPRRIRFVIKQPCVVVNANRRAEQKLYRN